MAIIVGIGGVSRAGKTFLAKLIAGETTSLSTKILNQDAYAKPIHEIELIQGHTDWESPQSIDFPRYKNAIIDASNQSDIVIAEGLLSLYDPDIVQLFDKKIFISLSYAEFERRKQNDLRWGKEPEWYIRHIWDCYLQYGQYTSGKADTLMIDGETCFNIEDIIKFTGI